MDLDITTGRQRDMLSAVLADAGVNRKSAIRVAGKAGLAPLIWLCRHGFEDVAYVRQGCAAPHDSADVLLVLHKTPQAELEMLLAESLHLREGGVLVINTEDARPADGGPDPVHALLERAGYAVEHCFARRDGELHIARRRGTAVRRAA